MKKTTLIMNSIYVLIFVLVAVISYFYIEKTKKENDIIAPTLEVNIVGSNVTINAKDNTGVTAYAYNSVNQIPETWHKANGEKEYTDTLRIVTEGTYYIWVKDSRDNISEVKKVSLSCKSGRFNGISDDIYCPYSSVNAFGYNWHVLEDNGGYITLFMDSEQLEKMNHCDTLQTSEFCYYVSNEDYDSYAWDKSIINNYLNNEFLEKLNVTLKDVSVCTDRSGQTGCIDNDGCGGYLNTQINDLGYFCHKQFIASKVRLLTVLEYSDILSDLDESELYWVYGTSDYWTMNAWKKPIYAGSIRKDGTYVIDTDTTKELDVRPVIVVKK